MALCHVMGTLLRGPGTNLCHTWFRLLGWGRPSGISLMASLIILLLNLMSKSLEAFLMNVARTSGVIWVVNLFSLINLLTLLSQLTLASSKRAGPGKPFFVIKAHCFLGDLDVWVLINMYKAAMPLELFRLRSVGSLSFLTLSSSWPMSALLQASKMFLVSWDLSKKLEGKSLTKRLDSFCLLDKNFKSKEF